MIRSASIRIDPGEIVEFNLNPIFARLEAAVDRIGAQRIVLDTVEVLYSALGNPAIVRSELIRLSRWSEDRGLTLVVTGEKGDGTLTRHGIEEYVSDCVISLDHRVKNEISTRRLRIIKYRGTVHGTSEYPFLIGERGFQVIPASAMGLTYDVSNDMVSILMSFEESPEQIIRNMASVGIDLRRWIDAGLLTIQSQRSSAAGLEAHLGSLARLLDELQPKVVVLDAIASPMGAGDLKEVTSTVAREIDILKARGITAVLTTRTHGVGEESSAVAISSLAHTWLLLRNTESDEERNRLLFVIKSRGVNHSNQVREFRLTNDGAVVIDVYVGPQGVLTGSARELQVARRVTEATERQKDVARRREVLKHRAKEVDAQIALLRAKLALEQEDLEAAIAEEDQRREADEVTQAAAAKERG